MHSIIFINKNNHIIEIYSSQELSKLQKIAGKKIEKVFNFCSN